jgi:hypothetical protein
MKKIIGSGLLALGVLGVVCVPPARSVDQARIDRAIRLGVSHLRGLQRENGSWITQEKRFILGATALAGLTLLECDVDPSDKAVTAAAQYVRQAGIDSTITYSIATAILFLDRLGDPADLPLIESLAVRLMAGQNMVGGWGYDCPAISAEEMRRLTTNMRGRTSELSTTRRDSTKPEARRTPKDLSKEIQAQLEALKTARGGGFNGDDNSNTQFATIALWVARRNGLPVEDALQRIDNRFRGSQAADGGWGYMTYIRPPGGNVVGDSGVPSTATMTCAGALGLTVADGALVAAVREQKPGAKPPDISKDPNLAKGLAALSTAIDYPVGDRKDATIPEIGGTSYYFLWSLERVCMALDLQTLDKKDWYVWGAEILLHNQQADGSWRGMYSDCGADTCFALLFLKRSNLARDLTAGIRGKVKDNAEAVLRAGGIGGGGLRKGPARLKPGMEGKNTKPDPDKGRPGDGKQETRPDKEPKTVAPPLGDSPEDRLAAELVRAPAAEQGALILKLQETKGSDNTVALARAIPHLQGETQQKARDALEARLTRLKPQSLVNYLEDEEPEIRRAAAQVCGAKKLKAAVPMLIGRLRDREDAVVRAAHAALKELSGQDLGTMPDPWKAWWEKNKD